MTVTVAEYDRAVNLPKRLTPGILMLGSEWETRPFHLVLLLVCVCVCVCVRDTGVYDSVVM